MRQKLAHFYHWGIAVGLLFLIIGPVFTGWAEGAVLPGPIQKSNIVSILDVSHPNLITSLPTAVTVPGDLIDAIRQAMINRIGEENSHLIFINEELIHVDGDLAYGSVIIKAPPTESREIGWIEFVAQKIDEHWQVATEEDDLFGVWSPSSVPQVKSITYNRSGAVAWASQPGSGTWGNAVGNYNDGGYRGVNADGTDLREGRHCTTYVVRALATGGVPNLSWDWGGNGQVVQWMVTNTDKWISKGGINELEAGDFILYSNNPSAPNDWSYVHPTQGWSLWNHIVLVTAPGKISEWNPEYLNVNYAGHWDSLPYRMFVHIDSGNLPTAPANTNLVRNPSFDSGINEWSFTGDIQRQAYNWNGDNMLLWKRIPGSTGYAAVHQTLNYSLPAGSPFEMTIQFGNSSGVTKYLRPHIHHLANWEGGICDFEIPPNAGPHTYTIRGRSINAWSNMRVWIEGNPADGLPDILMDDISVKYLPSLSVSGTECIYPAPDKPTITSPANGGTITNPSNFNVTLQPGWANRRPGSQTIYQVQISTTSSFSSTIFDKTSSSSTIAVTPAIQGGTYYLRVRQGDNLGLFSGWTSTITFIVSGVDLTLSKSDNVDPVQPGALLTYTLLVRNSGSQTATSVTLTDTLHSGVTYNSATTTQGSCSISGSTVTCNIGSMAPNASATVTIRVAVNSSTRGTLHNTASVTATQSDTNPANNTDSEDTVANYQTDLSISGIDTPDPVRPGSNLLYTLTVTNKGPKLATNVTVTDTLPSGVTYNSSTTTQGSCSISDSQVTCQLGSLKTGTSATISLDMTINLLTRGALRNTATVISNEIDTATSDNTTTQTTKVEGTTDVAVTLTASDNPAAGKMLDYTIITINKGPETATSLQLNDTLPASVTFVSTSSSQGMCSRAGSLVTCNLGNLAVGKSALVTIRVTVNGTARGTFSNTASISQAENDSNTANNSASVSTTVNAKVDLGITQKASDEPILAGTNLVYTITIKNNGPATATNVRLTDALPAGTSLVSTNMSQGSCSSSTGIVTCNLGSLPASNTATATITVVVGSSTKGTLTNTASVIAIETDTNSGNNTSTETTVAFVSEDGTNQGDLSWGNTLSRSMSTTSHRWHYVSGGYTGPYLIDIQRTSGNLQYDLILKDGGGTRLVTTHSSVDGRGIVVIEPPVGSGDRYLSIIPRSGTSGGYNIALWAESRPRLDFRWCNSAHSDIRRWNFWFDQTYTYYISAARTDGDLEFTYSLQPRGGGNIASGTSVNGKAVAATTSGSGWYDFYMTPSNSTIGSYQICIGQGVATPDPPSITNPKAGALSAQNFNVGISASAGNGRGTPDFHLQIDNTCGFSSPDFDSGWTRNTSIAVTLSPGSWCLRAQQGDGIGMASNWTTPITFTVQGADLALTQTDVTDPVKAGANLTYLLTVSNNGPTNATNVTVTDTIPTNTLFVSVNSSMGSCNQAAGIVTCSVSSLAANTRITITLNVAVDLLATGTLSNTAHISSSQTDPNTNNNTASQITTISSAARPAAPSGLAVTALSESQIRLMWTDNSGDETQFRLERSLTGSSGWLALGTVEANKTLFFDMNLTCSTSYFYRVRAFRSADKRYSLYSNISSASTQPCAAPTLATPAMGAVLRNTKPTFRWNTVSGARNYRLQVDNNANFSSQEINATTSAISYTSTIILTDKQYYWRVRTQGANGKWGTWSVVSTFTVDTIKPMSPTLRTPAQGATVHVGELRLRWSAVSDAVNYHIQVSTRSNFASLELNKTTSSLSYVSTLSAGQHYWRVRARDAAGNLSNWSVVRQFNLVNPIIPPKTVTPSPTPTRQSVIVHLPFYDGCENPENWYQDNTWQLETNTSISGTAWFGSSVERGKRSTLTLEAQLDLTGAQAPHLSFWQKSLLARSDRFIVEVSIDGGATWFVLDKQSGAVSDWTQRVIDLAGYRNSTIKLRFLLDTTAALLGNTSTLGLWLDELVVEDVVPTPTPTPTEAGTATPTPTIVIEVPTSTPTKPVVDMLQRVESNDSLVRQAGNWTAHNTDVASGGSYLYSSGSFDDMLSLSFMGTQVEVIYVKHPALGTFAVEIDGAVLQTVNSTAADSMFGAQAVVAGLADGPHTLRVYPVAGVVAIDAFGVESLADVTLPTPTPTDTPAQESTPTDLPPDLPSLTPIATNTPPSVQLPLVETFDSGLNWLPVGVWVFDTQIAYRGAGWFANSMTRGQVSTLTFNAQIDLRATLNPELSFWYKPALSNRDVFAVDLSLDSGLTWLPLDQQTGQETDWTLRSIDLSAYRGYVILLRFRLDTMAVLPEGIITTGVWLDELVIQEALPTPILTDIPTGEPSATDAPTTTLIPTDTPTVMPTSTWTPTDPPLPTATPTDMPTETPVPSVTPTAVPLETPIPTESLIETPVPNTTEEPVS